MTVKASACGTWGREVPPRSMATPVGVTREHDACPAGSRPHFLKLSATGGRMARTPPLRGDLIGFRHLSGTTIAPLQRTPYGPAATAAVSTVGVTIRRETSQAGRGTEVLADEL